MQTTFIKRTIKVSFLTLLSVLLLFTIQGFKEISNTKTFSTLDIFTDSRDGQRYTYKTMKDGKKWMTQNLNYKMTDSWCSDDNENKCKEYGRLYTFRAAKKACPVGWRLPSDNEWRAMVKYYGGCDEDSKDKGKAAYKTLMPNGSTDLSVQLGGYRSSEGNYYYYFLDEFGYYWSSTEKEADSWSRTKKDADRAWYYGFDSHDSTLYRYANSKTLGLSCRCIQE